MLQLFQLSLQFLWPQYVIGIEPLDVGACAQFECVISCTACSLLRVEGPLPMEFGMILLNSVKDLFGVIVRMVIDQNDFLNDVVALNNATLQGA